MAYAIQSHLTEFRVVTTSPNGAGVEGVPTTNREQAIAELQYLQAAFKGAPNWETKVELQARAVGEWTRIEATL